MSNQFCLVFVLTFRRDLIAMLSLAGEEQVINHTCLFSALLCVLTCQVKSIERDFFEVRKETYFHLNIIC